MTQIFHDDFDSVSAVNLEAHTPNVGSAWTKLSPDQSALVGAGTGSVQFAGGGTPNRIAYNTGISTADLVMLLSYQVSNTADKVTIWLRRQGAAGAGLALEMQEAGSILYYYNGTSYVSLTNGSGGSGTLGSLPTDGRFGAALMTLTLSANNLQVKLGNNAPFINFTTNGQVTAAGTLQVEIVSSSAYLQSIDIDGEGSGGGSAPSITSQPSNQSVATPSTATFSIAATGATNYQWQRSTNGGSSFSDVTTGTGGTTAAYTTPATSVSGGGANNNDQYRCVVSNGTGSTTSNAATLTVTSGSSAPVFSAHPGNQTLIVGATATLSATSSGSPTPTSQWQRSTDGGTVWYDIPGATGATYALPAVALKGGNANAGDRFRRKDTNSAGSATSNAATLTVTGGSASMTSGSLGRNGGTLNGAETLAWVKVVHPTTGEDVTPIMTSIAVNSSSQFALTGLPAGTYAVFYRSTSSGRMGCALGVAA